MNTVRDGLSVQEGRYAAGVGSTTLINPDMVGEFRVILSPVDAEMGRGNGQVQILTKSGTNALHGSAVWSVRNSALDANTWTNNRQVVNGVWKPTQPTWVNRHQATVSAGGPILRNKTFFFGLYDQQFERQRGTARPVVLTDCARNGIFRYWEGWGNGNTLTPTNTGTAAPAIASVDSFGNPVRPATSPTGGAYTGQLRYFSVFGAVTNTPTRPDCSDAQISGTPFDANRTQQDPAGITQKYISAMPHANVFDAGDGLNTAVHQWLRSGHNSAAFGLANGTDNNTDRKQINVKVDHNFNSSHKVAVNYSHEWIIGDYLGGGAANAWPGYYPSEVIRRPKVLTVNGTSTFFGNVLNEARFGYRANKHVIWAPWEVTDASKTEVPLSLLLQGGQGFPIAYQPAAVGAMSTNNYVCMTLLRATGQSHSTVRLCRHHQLDQRKACLQGRRGYPVRLYERFGDADSSHSARHRGRRPESQRIIQQPDPPAGPGERKSGHRELPSLLSGRIRQSGVSVSLPPAIERFEVGELQFRSRPPKDYGASPERLGHILQG